MTTSGRPLNILYAGTLPPHPGGSAISASQLLSGMARVGHRVRAIAPITDATRPVGDEFERRHPALEVHRYRVPQYQTRVHRPEVARAYDWEERSLRELLLALAARERPDVLFAGREMYAWYVPDVGKELGLPLLLRVAGGTLFGLVSRQFPSREAQPLLERMRQFDLLLTPAAYMTRQLHAMGVPQTRTILNAIDLETFRPRPPDESLRRELGIGPTDRVVLSIGNLHPRKRSLDIARAVETALAAEPRLVCVMVGIGPLRGEIESHVQRAGIADRFRLPGWIPYADVPRYLSLAEAAVHAAEGEGLARAWLEAQASGVPLVASDIEALREVAVDGETALFFPVGNVDAMADQLIRLLGDAALRRRLADQARQRVAAHALPHAVAAYVEEIRALVEGRPRRP